VTEGEFHSIKMGGWLSLLEFECSLFKMKESEVVFLQQCHKRVLLHGSWGAWKQPGFIS